MRARDAWRALGIAPTDDAREVRRAYSVKLKAIDVDADPQAFIALRAAFEEATRLANQAAARKAQPEDDEDEDEEAFEPASAEEAGERWPASEPAQPARRSPWAAPEDSRAAAKREIFAELSAWNTPVDRERVKALADQLLDPIALERVDVAADTEHWFAHVILDFMPRSDVLVAPAINAFQWHRMASPPRHIERILARYRARRYVAENPSIQRTIERLQAPFEPPPGWRTLRDWRRVKALFDLIDERHDTLELDLDPAAMEWWRDRFGRPRLHWRDLGLAVLVATLMTFGATLDLPEDLALIGGIFGGALLVAGLVALWRLRVTRAQQLDEQWDAPPLRPIEAVAALISLALPILAVALPASRIGVVALGLAAAAACVLVGRRAEWGWEAPEQRRRRRWAPWLAASLWPILGVSLTVGTWFMAAAPILAASVTAHALYHRLGDWRIEDWRIERIARPAIVALGAALVIAAMLGLFGPAGPRFGVAGASVLLLVQHVTNGSRVALPTLGNWVTWVGAIAIGRVVFEAIPQTSSGSAAGVGEALAAIIAALALYRAARMAVAR